MATVWALIRSPRWIGLLVFAVVLASLCLWAAHWQWGRYQTKRERRVEVHAAAAAPAVPLAQLATPGSAADPAVQYRTARVSGTYDTGGQLLVRNPLGRTGYEVVTPLVLDDGGVLFVDRGWVPLSDQGAAVAPDVPPPPTGPVTATVRLRLPEPEGSDRTAPAGQVYGFDLAQWAADASGPVVPMIGDLVSQDPPAPSGLALPDPPDVGLGPHLFYTVQWIFFAGFAAVGYVLLLRREATADPQDNEAAAASSVTSDPSTNDS